jgi:polysaccharide biosynthesis transport protein
VYTDNTPRIEPLQPWEHHGAGSSQEPWHRSGRARIFGFVFTLALLIGLIYTLLQPVVYRSSATVLMSALSAIDASASEADVQGVAIQRKILLGNEITGRLTVKLEEEYGVRLSIPELRRLLAVDPLPETNLVEMTAQGPDGEMLPILVNSWIDGYLAVRAEEIEQRKEQTMLVVQGELDGLAAKLYEARELLEKFRSENEIISMERQENEVLARLDGLNKALNNAIEEEAKTGAYLSTLRQAIARGELVVPKTERSVVEDLDRELRQLQAQMSELSKRYTKDYISKEPKLRAIPVRIEELNTALAIALRQGREAEMANALQAHDTATQTSEDLQRTLERHKQAVAQFNTIYATHQALAEDLARLEELHRETQARLVQVEVRQVEKYPQVSVIDRPGSESERIGPNYLLLLGSTLGAAIGLGVFAVWLFGYLSPKPAHPGYVTISGVHMYPQDIGGHIGYAAPSDGRLAQDATARLENQRRDHDEGLEGDEKETDRQA